MSHGKILLIAAVVAVLLFVGIGIWNRTQPGTYDAFAQCIADSGATFYGAFWCPHCQEQKAMFGRSAALLPYEECSTPDGQEQVAACTEAGVRSYPTWIFPDGTVLAGVQQFEDLADATGCSVPL